MLKCLRLSGDPVTLELKRGKYETVYWQIQLISQNWFMARKHEIDCVKYFDLAAY